MTLAAIILTVFLCAVARAVAPWTGWSYEDIMLVGLTFIICRVALEAVGRKKGGAE